MNYKFELGGFDIFDVEEEIEEKVFFNELIDFDVYEKCSRGFLSFTINLISRQTLMTLLESDDYGEYFKYVFIVDSYKKKDLENFIKDKISKANQFKDEKKAIEFLCRHFREESEGLECE